MKETSTVIILLIEQYKFLRLEEIVSKNIFRSIWFALALYSSGTVANIQKSSIQIRDFNIWGLQPAGIFIVAMALYFLSTRYEKKVARQSLKIREMLFSLDSNYSDYYVYEINKEDIKNTIYTPFLKKITDREDAIWFGAVLLILYVNIAPLLVF